MNRRQARVIVLGMVFLLAMGLYPPWHHIFVNEVGGQRIAFAGFGSITNPPHPLSGINWYATRISLDILFTEWAVVVATTAVLVFAMRNMNDAELRPFLRYPR